MRDIDELQAYEYKQQLLVEGIVNGLYRETRDDENYRYIFGSLAERMLKDMTMNAGISPNERIKKLYEENIWKPIRQFVEEQQGRGDKPRHIIERLYLELKVFEKVFSSVSSGIVSSYHRHQLLAEMQVPAK